jgi:hypothetical protein
MTSRLASTPRALARTLRLALAAGFLIAAAGCSDDPTFDVPASADSGEPDATSGGDTAATPDGQATDAPIDPSADATADDRMIGTSQTVVALEAAHVFWTGWDEGQNAREVSNTVTMPPANELYERITMNFRLSCPDGRCDPWDRLGSFGMVLDADSETPTVVELSRFITPYAVGHNWQADVTDLRPLLTGEVTFRVFIDTWVGPGGPYGNGWQVDASFSFLAGEPERPVLAAIPVWPMTRVVYGDPARPIGEQLAPATVEAPGGASALALRTFITGHGQGNAGNCAEFCPQDHTFTVNGEAFSRNVWRDDCETTSAPNQQGTYQYPRAGWCPGDITHDWTLDLGAPTDAALEIAYGVEDYTNTCRPDAEVCEGCALGNGCEWNDSNHTEPNYQTSAILIAYE